MKLTHEQVGSYHQNGYLVLYDLFDSFELECIIGEMRQVLRSDDPRRILEKSGAVRSFFAPEFTSPLFYKLSRLQRLVEPAMELLGGEVYIHQTKLNTKHALVGDWWDWHQDFTFWRADDGMPACDVLTAMIYLNDVNDFNGPLLLVPGSHQVGLAGCREDAPETAEGGSEWFRQYQGSTTYMSALTADLKYTLDQATLASWIERKGIVSAKGPAGTVVLFHGNVFHASSNNLSPWDRHTFLVTYNSVGNTLPPAANPRPEFIAQRNFTPIRDTKESFLPDEVRNTEKINDHVRSFVKAEK